MSNAWLQSVASSALYITGKPGTDRNCGAGGNEVPEPATYTLMSDGLLGLGFVSRRRRRTS